MKKAAAGQRFVALLIDAIILFVASLLVSKAIIEVSGLEEPDFEYDCSEEVKDATIDYLNDYYSGFSLKFDDYEIDELALVYGSADENKVKDFINDKYPGIYDEVFDFYTYCVDYSKDCLHYNTSTRMIGVGVSLFLFVIYYCVIGYCWNKQTVGRLAMKIKLVSMDGEKPTVGKLLLRDFLGFYLFNCLNVCCFAPIIINAIFVCGRDALSVGDRLSGLLMVNYDDNDNIINDNGDGTIHHDNVIDEVNDDDIIINHDIFDNSEEEKNDEDGE